MTGPVADSLPRLHRMMAPVPGALVLLSDPLDVRWISGFTGGTSRLLVDCSSGRGWLIVDGRYEERACSEVGADRAYIDVVLLRSSESVDDATSRLANGAPVVVDPASITVAVHAGLSARCDVRLGTSNISELRRVKDPGELSSMQRAARIADDALMEVVSEGLEGRTEREIRDRLNGAMRRGGADGLAFDTIVASGENGSRPHHEPGDRIVQSGEYVIIDMGALVEGYRSDMTRTVAVGDVGVELRTMYEAVREAQEAAISAVKAGVQGRSVDRAAREHFAGRALAHEFVHGTGHGVGLAIHERPILGASCETELLEGEVVTVEPGLYRKGLGGVRIEDLLVVTGDTSRSLTTSPKDLSCPQSPRMI